MIYTWYENGHSIHAHASSLERARELVRLASSERSGLRKVSDSIVFKEPQEISCDQLAYCFNRLMAKRKDVFFCDGPFVRLYVTEGFVPEKKKSVFELFKDET